MKILVNDLFYNIEQCVHCLQTEFQTIQVNRKASYLHQHAHSNAKISIKIESLFILIQDLNSYTKDITFELYIQTKTERTRKTIKESRTRQY
jgi:hypothetical protein